MKSTIALLAIAVGVTACDIPGVPKREAAPPADQGLGAGATAAAPAPTPIDSTTRIDSTAPVAPAMQPNTPAPVTTASTAKKPAKVTDQTQSGVTDKSGSSTLGEKIKKPRPDANQPVTAKGDVLIMRVDSVTGAITTRRPGDSMPAVRSPGDTKGDSAFNQQKGDSLKPVAPPVTPTVRSDSLGPQKGDTAFQRKQADSMKVQGNDTMPAPKTPNTMPVLPTLPEPAPIPLPTPAPQPAPAPVPPK